MQTGTYRLEFRVFSGGSYTWADYTNRLIRFGNLTHRIEGLMRNEIRASIGDIVVNNHDSFWTLQTDPLLFDNPSEPYGKSFRKRWIRLSIDIPDSRGVVTNRRLFTGLVDDLIINTDGTATIKVISLDRMAQEQKLDGDKINNNVISGPWGGASCYNTRQSNGETENYVYSWHTDRRYQDYLSRISTALDDMGMVCDDIRYQTADGRRVTTTLINYNNHRPSADYKLQHIYFSPLHNRLLLVVRSDADGIFIYAWQPGGQETLTQVFNHPARSNLRIYAFWHNVTADRLYFMLSWDKEYRLYEMNASYNILSISLNERLGTNDIQGPVCYAQDRSSIIIPVGNETSYLRLEEWRCDNLNNFYRMYRSDNLINHAGEGLYRVNKMAYRTMGEVFFVGATSSTADELYRYDIFEGYLSRRSPRREHHRAFLDVYADSDRVYVIEYNPSTRAGWRIYSRLDTDADGAPWGAPVFSLGEDSYRQLSCFLRGGDCLYVWEYNNPTHEIPAYPSFLLAIKDTDKNVAVYDNLLDSSNTTGEFLVDGEVGELCTGEKIYAKFVNAEFAHTFVPSQGDDWYIIGATWSPGGLLYQHAKTISHYTRLWEARNLSAWQMRVMLAEKWGAVAYYDEDGIFHFRQRPTGDAETTISSHRITKIDSGYRKVVNYARGSVYRLPYNQPKLMTSQPVCIRSPLSTVTLSRVIFGDQTKSTKRWRVRMTSATAYNLEEETAPSVWTTRATGTMGTTLVYSGADAQITIPSDAWTGTARAGDIMIFWAYLAELSYSKGDDVERIEAMDPASIERYQRSEVSLDNKFIQRIVLPDILAGIIALWSRPRRTLTVNVPVDLSLPLLGKVRLTDDIYGILPSTAWYISCRTIKYGQPDMELELTEIL